MEKLTQRLQALLDRAVAEQEFAGMNLLVRRGGEELAYVQAGYADAERGVPFSRNTIARMYSMTKPVTAAAAMLLVERGQLDLGQSVSEFLPGFRDQTVWQQGERVPVRRDVQVKDLLNMTSGLSYPGDDEAGREAGAVFHQADQALYGSAPMDTLELANRLGRCSLAFQPGERWMYGTSADVLGAVIQQVSGLRFGEFLRRELFAPLGMEDTGFYVPEKQRHRLAQVYERAEGKLLPYPTNNLDIRYTQDVSPAFESGGAGLVSTIDDYAKFAQMLLNGGQLGGVRVMQPGTVDFLTHGQLTPWQLDSMWRSWDGLAGYGYGNLMRVMEQPGMALCNPWPGEYGWDGWLGTYFCNSPANGVTVLLLCQRRDTGTSSVTRKIRNVLTACL